MSPEISKKIDNLKKSILSLKKGFLAEHRKENNYIPVIGEGSFSAKIMFIGEAPGKNEAITGRPFCGSAGRVLDELLGHVGFLRQEIYITNIVKDRPPKNRDPLPDEISLYSPFLDEEIEIIKPKIIATLGRYSMKYVIEKYGFSQDVVSISEAHGKFFRTKKDFGNMKILALYHPCVAVYDPRKKDILKKDISLLKNI